MIQYLAWYTNYISTTTTSSEKTNTNDPALILTAKGFDKIYELISEVNEPGTLLRVYIQGGGCAGFEYGFEFDQNVDATDWLMCHRFQSCGSVECDLLDPKLAISEQVSNGSADKKQVLVVIDPFSYPLMAGSTLDYVDDDPAGCRFVFKNPRAKRTCGCGSSFST